MLDWLTLLQRAHFHVAFRSGFVIKPWRTTPTGRDLKDVKFLGTFYVIIFGRSRAATGNYGQPVFNL